MIATHADCLPPGQGGSTNWLDTIDRVQLPTIMPVLAVRSALEEPDQGSCLLIDEATRVTAAASITNSGS